MQRCINVVFFITQKKINEIQEKGLEPKSVQYHLEHLEEIEKENKVNKEIPKLKKEIKNLNSLINTMINSNNENMNKDEFENYNTRNNSCKNKLKNDFINIANEQMFDSLKEYQTTKTSKLRETNYQMDTFRNIKLLSPITNGNSDKKIYKKKPLIHPSLSSTQKNFYRNNKNRDEKSAIIQKTKTTFYSIKNKKEKIDALIPKNEKINFIHFKNKELKGPKDAYEELKLISMQNKNIILNKIDQYLESKGYNVDHIKNSLKKEELYNFFDKIKNIAIKYKCKQNITNLYSKMGKKESKNLTLNLNEINQLNKEISAVENLYYISLLKG